MNGWFVWVIIGQSQLIFLGLLTSPENFSNIIFQNLPEPFLQRVRGVCLYITCVDLLYACDADDMYVRRSRIPVRLTA